MAKEKKEMKKGYPLLTTAQSNAYKQIVGKQSKTLTSGSKNQLNTLLSQNPESNYISIFKKNYKGIQERHMLDDLQVQQYSYDKKAKRDRHFNLKYEDLTKSCLNAPLTSNQQYGWKQPIDTFPTKFGVRQKYDEKLMISLKNNKKK